MIILIIGMLMLLFNCLYVWFFVIGNSNEFGNPCKCVYFLIDSFFFKFYNCGILLVIIVGVSEFLLVKKFS